MPEAKLNLERPYGVGKKLLIAKTVFMKVGANAPKFDPEASEGIVKPGTDFRIVVSPDLC